MAVHHNAIIISIESYCPRAFVIHSDVNFQIRNSTKKDAQNRKLQDYIATTVMEIITMFFNSPFSDATTLIQVTQLIFVDSN